jgi:hypothetical protein
MKHSAYGTPLLIKKDNTVTTINKVNEFDELTIQKIIFNHPSCLPISDIDEAYNPVIPVCMELNLGGKYMDVFMVSPNGELTIIETKLWRNPEARRKVVAQILEYAQILATWSYSDLQREVSRNTGRKGNTLYDIAKENDPNQVLEESVFVDAVERNLRRGNFLLLIVGDGIREGAKGIGEFLSSSGNLNFTLAMVELSLFKTQNSDTLVIPKTIVKTVEIGRINIDLPDGMIISQDEKYKKDNSSNVEDNFYVKFWKELVDELDFDDPGQPLPNPGKGQNLFIYPVNLKKSWISAYFSKSKNRIGVYFRTANDQEGDEIGKAISMDEENIIQELGGSVQAEWGEKINLVIRKDCNDIHDPANREEIKEFFKYWLNEFVNVIRPRMKAID